jgi:hypothetical protein
MSTLARSSAALPDPSHPADDDVELSRLEARLPPLLSVIAGMVDLTGFFTLALQLPFLTISESMGNHDSKIVDADSVD